jgi:orotidine-5'-phosphate decarboxylase
VNRLGLACALVEQLKGVIGFVKVGNQLFTAEGPQAVRQLAGLGADIFLDLKFHDIPNTVSKAVAAAAELPNVRLLTMHASGGIAMMKAASEAVAGIKGRPALLGVTILTSLDNAAIKQVGLGGTISSRAVALARLAKKAGLDGVVSSGHEVRAIRRACGEDFLILVPSVRPAGSASNDQARVATPAEAARAGANYLVVGRPITAATNPREAALAIVEEVASARSMRQSV